MEPAPGAPDEQGLDVEGNGRVPFVIVFEPTATATPDVLGIAVTPPAAAETGVDAEAASADVAAPDPAAIAEVRSSDSRWPFWLGVAMVLLAVPWILVVARRLWFGREG